MEYVIKELKPYFDSAAVYFETHDATPEDGDLFFNQVYDFEVGYLENLRNGGGIVYFKQRSTINARIYFLRERLDK